MKRNGFTLIELILVVAILLILMAGGAPFYSRFINQNAVENTTVQLLGNLRKAQIYSMMGKQNDAWGVDYRSQTITLFKGANYAGRTVAFDEQFTVNNSITVSSTGVTEVDYAKATGLTANVTPTITFTISGGNTTKTINVNGQGVATR